MNHSAKLAHLLFGLETRDFSSPETRESKMYVRDFLASGERRSLLRSDFLEDYFKIRNREYFIKFKCENDKAAIHSWIG